MASQYQSLRSATLCCILVLGFLNVSWSAQEVSRSSPYQKIQEIVNELAQSHGLDAAWQDLGIFRIDNISFEEISSRETGRFLAFLQIFREEVQKYPSNFFRQSGLSKVIFTRKLFFHELPARGAYRSPEGYMFFDIYRDFGNQAAQRHGIHHEIYHMIATTVRAREGILPLGQWESFNEPDFKYEKQGSWHGQRNRVNYFAPPRLGFVTDYAFVSAEEDKAELFACLFIKSQNRLIHQWKERDPVLAQKISAMKGFLQEYLPQINDQFWKDLFR